MATFELPGGLETLKQALGKLPGIGPRSAERLALHIVQCQDDWVRHLSGALIAAKERIAFCRDCGSLTEEQPCSLCADPNRDGTLICVVERPTDIYSFEKSSFFKGLYHVLGGHISPLNGVEPEDLRIRELEQRLEAGTIKELVLALGSNVEGDSTCYYLGDRMRRTGLRITRLAQGVPVGGGLEFVDELTIERALEGRRQME